LSRRLPPQQALAVGLVPVAFVEDGGGFTHSREAPGSVNLPIVGRAPQACIP
jgi:hypothetical protein